MAQESYCSFEVAKLLQEKGFNEECRAAYTNYGKLFTTQIQQYITNIVCSKGTLWDCTAPTHQTARRWLREIHNIFISINLTLTEEPDEYPPMYYVYILDTKTGKSLITYNEENLVVDENKQPRCFAEPEQAVEAALKYTLGNLI